MTRQVPLCDKIAQSVVDKLSDETKRRLYDDLKAEYSDQARDIMECESIEAAYNQFAFHVFWSIQHQLMAKMGMDDDEIERRVY